MKILLSMNYTNTLYKHILQPLVQSVKIGNIHVVHSLEMPNVEKVRVYATPKLLKSPTYKITIRGILRTITQLILMIYLTFKKKPDIIIGFHLFPHCIYAFICGKIFKKPIISYIDDCPGIWQHRKKLIPILKHCDIIITVGSRAREYLIKYGIDENRIYIVPNTIDVDMFKPVSLPTKYDIISIGRLAPAKRIDTLLRVVSKVRNFKKNVKVGVVGDGPLRDSLEELTTKLNLSDNVDFLGWVENPELYYNYSTIYVLTSYYEAGPMTMLEAMACGIPCVLSNVGNVSDVSVDGFNAIIIDNPYDVDAFSNAIVELLKNNELCERLSKNARAVVEERYCYKSGTKVWDEILDLLKSKENNEI